MFRSKIKDFFFSTFLPVSQPDQALWIWLQKSSDVNLVLQWRQTAFNGLVLWKSLCRCTKFTEGLIWYVCHIKCVCDKPHANIWEEKKRRGTLCFPVNCKKQFCISSQPLQHFCLHRLTTAHLLYNGFIFLPTLGLIIVGVYSFVFP